MAGPPTRQEEVRRERIEGLIEMACASRDWSRARLAREIGRDPSNLIPEGGNPKLDWLMALARALEWPVGEVAEALWGDDPVGPPAKPSAITKDYKTLHRESYEAFLKADHHTALDLARQMEVVAATPDEQARAIGNQAGYLNMLGRHVEASECAGRGLALEGLSPLLRSCLQTNLVLAFIKLNRFHIALGLTTSILERTRSASTTEPYAQLARAFAHYAGGYSRLQLAFVESDCRVQHLTSACVSLDAADGEFARIAADQRAPELLGMQRGCSAWRLECRVELGEIAPCAAIDEVMRALDGCVDPKAANPYDLESCGWMALAGCAIAIRHLDGPELQRVMAVCTEKALECAEKIDHWYIQERAVTMQYLGRRRLSELSRLDFEYVIDDEDRARIASLMSRFPQFRALGWRILRSSRVVGH